MSDDQTGITAASPAPAATDRALDDMSERVAREVFAAASARYFAVRRARVPEFVDRHFSVRGTLRLHRHALGWDLVRAPANIALAVPALSLRVAAAASRRLGAERAGDWLGRRDLLLATDVGREIAWRVHVELLELPYAQGARISTRDALAEEMLADPRVDTALRGTLAAIGRCGDDPAFRRRLTEALAVYAGSRAAAAEIATALISLGIGAVAFKQLTPGMVSLGPAVAAAVAHHAAIASFPLGAGLGGLWYGLFPAQAGAALTAGVTGGLMAAAAVFAAFAGVLTDPVQQRLGLHQRRLLRLIDVLERNFRGDGAARFAVRDHYVARLLDLFDVLRAAYRLAHPGP